MFCSNSLLLAVLQDFCSLLVRWLLGVRLQEEMLQAINFGVYHKEFILSEEVEAGAALEVKVGMISHCFTLYLGRLGGSCG